LANRHVNAAAEGSSIMNKYSTAELKKVVEWLSPSERPSDPLAHYRITLMRDEPYRLPAGTREVEVLSGGARLVSSERERLLENGEKQMLKTGEIASVTAISSPTPLILHMGVSAKSAEQARMKQMFYMRMAARQQLIEAEEHAAKKW
jgi:hypothetical protein